jgi:hypothetical protein
VLLRRRTDELDLAEVRAAAAEVVEGPRSADWLAEVPDQVLIEVAAPLEVLSFHYYLQPPRERHLARAARVACEAVRGQLAGCPPDMAAAFRRLGRSVRVEVG